jgi:polyhydroxyalkanoate synthesis regulator phasin
MKTPEELDELKRNWEEDPCWDLEDTEGFEDHYLELLRHRQWRETQIEYRLKREFREFADKIGCRDNHKLAKYLEQLEQRIERLEDEQRDRD